MEILLFFIFAVVFALAFNWAMPQLTTQVAKYPKIATYQSTYYGQTLITAVLVFVLLLVVGFVFAAAGEKAAVGTVQV
jgi:ABC-type Fe3+ transport system permease subunit